MTSMEFIAHELSTTPTELRNHCRSRELVRKRWTAMCFYRLMNFSNIRIGAYLDLDRRTVTHGLERADDEIRLKARECYLKYTNKEPDKNLLPRRTKIIHVPDYKTGKIIEKEIEV